MLPPNYAWLTTLGLLPRMVTEAVRLLGVRETPGTANNVTIMSWAKETGLRAVYSADSIPWCGLFMALIAQRAGKTVPKDPLWARNWLKFGVAAPRPELGDVLVFARDSGGHVGLYIGEDDTAYHVLGGNQSDAVTITRIEKSRLLGARRFYGVGAPASVKPYQLQAKGPLSRNEA